VRANFYTAIAADAFFVVKFYPIRKRFDGLSWAHCPALTAKLEEIIFAYRQGRRMAE